MELWRDIPGYEGLYQASNLGNIRTCEGKTTSNARYGVRRWKQRIIKQKCTKNQNGREDARVDLWKDGVKKTWLVSRLIGLTWCAGYADGMTINHINGNSLDNRAQNLEWISLSRNIQKGFEDGLFSQIQKPVVLETEGKSFPFKSMAEASRFLGRNPGYIHNCLKCSRPIMDTHGKEYTIMKGCI